MPDRRSARGYRIRFKFVEFEIIECLFFSTHLTSMIFIRAISWSFLLLGIKRYEILWRKFPRKIRWFSRLQLSESNLALAVLWIETKNQWEMSRKWYNVGTIIREIITTITTSSAQWLMTLFFSFQQICKIHACEAGVRNENW